MILTESVRTATFLANQGDLHSAIEVLGDLWPGIGVEPLRNGEGDQEYARLLLVCGILSMELGRFRSIPVQASAKDLLSKSVRLFGDEPDRLVALYWLGWSYVFCGENHEALSLADTILAEQTGDSDVVFRAGRLKALAHMNLGNFAQAEAAFKSVEVFIETAPPLSRGKFYLDRGVLLRQTDRLAEALVEYQRAVSDFRAAGSLRHEASAANNASVVYMAQGRYAEAHEAAQIALSVFRQLDDRAHEAKVWDQIAQIYGREENEVEMEKAAARAVELLSGGDHEGWLAEALITHGVALYRLGMTRGKESLSRALEICNRQGDPKQAAVARRALWGVVQHAKGAQEDLQRSVLPLERTVYENVLADHGGHVSPAGRELGYNHQAFQLRLENHFPELLTKRRPRRRRRKTLTAKN